MRVERLPNVAERLQAKYGLESLPTSEEVAEFYRMVRYLRALGKGDLEDKGYQAAVTSFDGVGAVLRESEADTLEMLLKMIEGE